MQFKSYACECKNTQDSHAAFRPVLQPHRIIRWPKRVNHKSVYYNTKQFHKTQISLPKHKTISQNTNQFTKTQNNCSKHKSVCQNTNHFSKRKPISRATNQKTTHLLERLIPKIFRVQYGDCFTV